MGRCALSSVSRSQHLQSKCHDNSNSVFSLFSQCKVAVSNVLKIIDFLFVACEFCCFLLIEMVGRGQEVMHGITCLVHVCKAQFGRSEPIHLLTVLSNLRPMPTVVQ